MKLISTILLAVWGTLSLLGHAGVHALAEKCGVCCETHQHAAEQNPGGSSLTKRSAFKHRHDQGCCCHSHGEQKCGEESSEENPPKKAHDSSHCLICDWFLKCQSGKLTFVCVVAEASLVFRLDVVSHEETVQQVLAPTSRGPPELA